MAYTQEHRLIRIATPLGGDELLLTGFRGHEEISRLFHFKLSLLSHNHSIDFKTVIGGNVTVSILLKNEEERFFNGIVASFSQSSGNVMADRSGGAVFSHYTATIVPWLWLLDKTSDLRIFQKKTAVEIIEQIFIEKGFSDYTTTKLTGTYHSRTYCVQYRETDFNFISRLMEEEGISYYFIHENGKHTLVLADASTGYTSCPHYEHVRYQQAASGHGDFFDEDVIKSLELKNEIRVGKYSLNDYNFEKPNAPLRAEVSGENLGPGEKEVYDYPGLYTDHAEGEKIVRVRIQEEERQIASVTGTSDVPGFGSGFSFTLEDYFRDEMNNKKYLLTAVDHVAEQGGFGSGDSGENRYTNTFTCILLDTPFRPVRLTPKPVVEGVQTAIVVGPAGEEIYTDEHGQVKVQFHWDRESQADENSSCWMRVGQLWAGTGWGALYIPRIGQEVIVDFLEGDPDRPIVIGSVYHGNNKPPYTLPDEKTKSTIKSNSSKGGGGFNEIRFEDKKDEEQIFIHGEKDLDIRIKETRKEYIGKNRHLTVEEDQFALVKKSKHQQVQEDYLEKVDGDVNTTIGGDRVVKISGKDHLSISGDLMLKSGGATHIKSALAHNQESGSDYSIKSGGDIYEKAGGQIGVESGTAIHIKGGTTVVIEAGIQLSLKAGGNFVDIGPAGVSISGTLVNINSGGAAASGSGCTPSPPAPADPPESPVNPLMPVDAKAGKTDVAPEGRSNKEKKDQLDSSTVKKYENPQAQALATASEDGTPFCKECEAARQRGSD